jgi:hypothetical protein
MTIAQQIIIVSRISVIHMNALIIHNALMENPAGISDA